MIFGIWRKVRDSNPRTPFRASFDFKSSAFNQALPTFRKQLNYNKIFSLNQANRKGARKLRDEKKSKNKKNCKKASKQKRFSKWQSDKSMNFQDRLVMTASIRLRDCGALALPSYYIPFYLKNQPFGISFSFFALKSLCKIRLCAKMFYI